MNLKSFCKLSILSSLLLLAIIPGVSQGDGQEGHGGDSYSAEFTAIADQLVSQIGGLPFDERYGISPVQFAAAIEKTLVESTDSPLYLENGTRLVDAINYPGRNLVILSRPSWDRMSFVRRQLIVVHEYSSIMGLDDENYKISAKVLMRLGQFEPAPYPSAMPTTEPTWAPSPMPSWAPSPMPSWSPTPRPAM